ncbi:MAG: glycosyltransferase [Clostridia bacterium]|nr:glycosyltransferase [Clostridia bacterium]
MKKNILISHVHMDIGGIETALFNMLNHMDHNKYNVDLMIYKFDKNKLTNIPNWVNVFPVWQNKRFANVYKKIVLSRNIFVRMLKKVIFNKLTISFFTPKKKYDYGIAYSGYFELTDRYILKSNAKNKYIWVHGDFYTQVNLNSKFEKKFNSIKGIYKHFDKIICVSDKCASNLKLICPEYKNKITKVWNFPNKTVVNIISNEYPLTLKGDKNIVAVGRLSIYKGFERLIETMKIIKDKNMNIHLYIIGDGNLKPKLKNMINIYNLNNHITLLGFSSNYISLVKMVDALIVPSDSESFSYSTIESLEVGTPVISTPTSGPLDIKKYIAPEGSLLISEDFTPEALFNVIDFGLKGNINKKFNFDNKIISDNAIKELDELLL